MGAEKARSSTGDGSNTRGWQRRRRTVFVHAPLSGGGDAAFEVLTGGGGLYSVGGFAVRTPQSVQSLPNVHATYSAPSPPSSQSRSFA